MKYKKNCCAYDWLRVMEKGEKEFSNLNALLKNDRTCYLDVCKVTTPQEFKDDPKDIFFQLPLKVYLLWCLKINMVDAHIQLVSTVG